MLKHPAVTYITVRNVRYGITLEDHARINKAQNELCAICGKKNESTKRVFAVDHHHGTGKVRGILCYGCNRLLVAFDDPVLHQKILDYLKKYE